MKVACFTSFFVSISFGGVLSSAVDLNDGMDEYFVDRAYRAATATNMAKSYDKGWTNPIWADAHIVHFIDPNWNDDAIYIEEDGVCYVGFQSTEAGIDWLQNANDWPLEVTNSRGTCKFHSGFAGGFFTSYKDQLEGLVEDCVANCDDNAHPDGCLVIGGHSQGGTIATVAHFMWADFKHQTFIMGNPGSLETPTEECDMDYDNVYRFINAMPKNNELKFDKVPYMTDVDQFGSFDKYHFGHHILISGNSLKTQAYYMGYNDVSRLYPWDHNPAPLGLAHRLEVLEGYGYDGYVGQGYMEVLKAMKTRRQFPVSTKGFSSGAACSPDSRNPDDFNMCESGVCKSTSFCFSWTLWAEGNRWWNSFVPCKYKCE